jgi:hypothetical protein
MKKKYLAYIILPVLAFTLASAASAHGWFSRYSSVTPEEIVARQTDMFQSKADLLGIDVDQVKSAWTEGKSLQEMAADNGISEEQLKIKMQEARLALMQDHMRILVDSGVITQAQADQRLEIMNSRMENGMGRGFHHGMGMGFRL